jgi:hypothetical protein
MHTRSKRYLRRHRARLRAERRASFTPFLQCGNRLVQKIAVGMKKRWPDIAGYSRADDLSDGGGRKRGDRASPSLILNKADLQQA